MINGIILFKSLGRLDQLQNGGLHVGRKSFQKELIEATEFSLHSEVLKWITSIWGTLYLDFFATCPSNKLPVFVISLQALQVDPLSMTWKRMFALAFFFHGHFQKESLGIWMTRFAASFFLTKQSVVFQAVPATHGRTTQTARVL